MKSRNSLILVLAIILIAVIFGIFYFTVLKQPSANPTNTTGDNSNLFPFGNGGTGGGTPNGGTGGTGQNTAAASSTAPRLRKLDVNPVAGVTAFARGGKTYFRYIERADGHIYESPAETTASSRVSNTTIPKIYEAYWTKDGAGLLLRYLKDDGETINSFYASLGAGAATSSGLTGSFLTPDISSVAVSPDLTAFAYLEPNGSGASVYKITTAALKSALLFSSPLREWQVAWPEKNTITATSKPSAAIPGVMYEIRATDGAATKILGDINGLTDLLSPDGKNVLYSESIGSSVRLKLLTIANHTSVTMPFTTLPEKCVWSVKVPTTLYCAVPSNLPNVGYPDTWYQGAMSFIDDLWSYDAITGSTTRILDSTDNGGAFDITNLALDPAEGYLVFINKNDLTPWAYRLAP